MWRSRYQHHMGDCDILCHNVELAVYHSCHDDIVLHNDDRKDMSKMWHDCPCPHSSRNIIFQLRPQTSACSTLANSNSNWPPSAPR